LRGKNVKTAFRSRILVTAVAALLATVAYTAYGADSDVTTGGDTVDTLGRALEK
jgi:hypothetical protein